MGYGAYVLPDGREAGYLIEATCDAAGCKVEIDRGFGYLCGQSPNGWRDPDEPGCGNYYCADHMYDHCCPDLGCGAEPDSELEDAGYPCGRRRGHEGNHKDWDGHEFVYAEGDEE